MPSAELQIALVIIAFLAGIGITAIGPGGIFLTIALYALLPLPPAVIAGTASATFVAAGVVGSLSYVRSGDLTRPQSRRLAQWVSGSSIVGALAGTVVNPLLDTTTFGALLGLATMVAGGVILVQRIWNPVPSGVLDLENRRGRVSVAALGLGLGFACALLGVGGPVFAVPALVLLGVPMITALAVAQVQSVFIAFFATLGYALQDAVSLSLGLLVGIPELAGVVIGWWIAQRTDPARLKSVLGAVLVVVGGYLLLR